MDCNNISSLGDTNRITLEIRNFDAFHLIKVDESGSEWLLGWVEAEWR